MNTSATETNMAIRRRAYRKTYDNWNYNKSVMTIGDAHVVPQTVQTTDHDLRNLFSNQLTLFNGGVYDNSGVIVEAALHLTMGRHVPDVKCELPETLRLSGTWLYGGFLFRQIGHMLTESIGRLWALDEFEQTIEGVVFVAMNGYYNPTALLTVDEWVNGSAELTGKLAITQEVLDVFGVDKPLHIVGQSARIDKLIVPSQLMGLLPYGELLGGHPDYRDYVRRRLGKLFCTKHLKKEKRLYISRSKFAKRDAASFFMEDLLERHFVDQGYTIVYPEQMSFKNQIALYNTASHIVLAAGSAAHVVALTMNGSQSVALLKRYKDQNDQFSPQIKLMGAQFVKTFDALKSVIVPKMEEDRTRLKPRSSEAIYIVDYSKLWGELSKHGFVDIPWRDEDLSVTKKRVDELLEKVKNTYHCEFHIASLDQISRG